MAICLARGSKGGAPAYSANRWNQGLTRPFIHPGSYSWHVKGLVMDSIIYLVGLIVVIMFILSFLGLR